MKLRKLGTQGLTVSELGLGCMGMSVAYGAADEAESLATIHRALDLGVTFLDTAEMYGVGANEQLVGQAIASRREQVVLATKFGIQYDSASQSLIVNGSPERVQQSCDGSLQRLGVDYIDLYYLHRVDPNVPIEETVGAMAELVQQGKVRYLGLSEAAATTIRRAHATHPISALQSEYSLWSREVEDEILPTIRELKIGFVPYSPMGRGFLAGKINSPDDFAADDFRRTQPRFQGENFYKNLQLVEQVKEIATQKQVTPGQLALAWVLAQGDDIVPIPGTKRRVYLEENVAAVDIQLTSEELAQIDAVIPKNIAAGDRYSATIMQTVNR
jgi:aryl-alcohol dehydrogenase-like predicted oxidoreductase